MVRPDPKRYIRRGGIGSAAVKRRRTGGTSNGPSNAPFDRWFRYPAGFSQRTLKSALQAASLRPGDLLVDPFVGAASGYREGVARGVRYAGLEVHPEIAELAQLKMSAFPRPQRIVEDAKLVSGETCLADATGETELVSRSFDCHVLQKLVGIRNELQAHPWQPTSRYLKWCLLGALRDCANVQVRWPYQRPRVARRPRISQPERAFLRRAEWMAEDLHHASDSGSQVLQGDARRLDDWKRVLGRRPADAIVTSPPYLNNFDYADATRLELYFWGVARTWSEMVTRVRADMLTATTQQARKAAAEESMERLGAVVPHTAAVVGALTSKLQKERSRRARGKEYDRVIGPYFEGMSRVLTIARRCSRPQARVVLVVGDSAPYGVHVDTPAILAALALELGFELLKLEEIRQRGTRWPLNGTRHQRLLTEQLVVLTTPSIQ